ncbi:MAG TPA: DUF1415 domain-containing protein [Burkholderiaceae bacterium]|nr:DUF1415 domain-containing protein [Burkholderiaceae bacterium]
MKSHANDSPQTDTVLSDTRIWLERAVIGLNLCPFAKGVQVKGQIHYSVSAATSPQDLLDDLKGELKDLMALDSSVRDTTLLIAPHCLQDFLDFNDFLPKADKVLKSMKLDGVIQIASFHPQFQFAGTDVDDITNYTNRAPYPTLHLIREASIDRAVKAFPEAETIFEANMQTMEQLGHEGWNALGVGPSTTHGKMKP